MKVTWCALFLFFWRGGFRTVRIELPAKRRTSDLRVFQSHAARASQTEMVSTRTSWSTLPTCRLTAEAAMGSGDTSLCRSPGRFGPHASDKSTCPQESRDRLEQLSSSPA